MEEVMEDHVLCILDTAIQLFIANAFYFSPQCVSAVTSIKQQPCEEEN